VLLQLEQVQRQQLQLQLVQQPQVLQRLAQVLGQQVQQLALLR
jgi:recombinational DNA repair protein RecT